MIVPSRRHHRIGVGARRKQVHPRLEILDDRILLAVNPIIAENQLPGTPTSVWSVAGAGDSTIQGFATNISVDHGQTVSFKINDSARAPYHIDIYRMGYYQGNGARLVTTISSSQTLDQVQPAPLTNTTTGLIDAGNWAVSASWVVPASATSGIYFARVGATTRGERARSFSSSVTTRARRISCSRPPIPPGRPTIPGAESAFTKGRPILPAAASKSATTGRSSSTSRPTAITTTTRPGTPNTRWCAGWRPTATTSATSPTSIAIGTAA